MSIEKKKEILITLLYFVSLGVLLYLFIQYCFWASLPFLIGGFVATLLKPIVNSLTKGIKVNRKATSFFVVLIFYFIIISLAVLFTGKGFTKLADFFKEFPDFFLQKVYPTLVTLTNKVEELIQTHFSFITNWNAAEIYSYLQSTVLKISDWGIGLATDFVFGIPKLIVGIFFTILATFLISADYIKITVFLQRHLATKNFQKVLRVQQSVMRAIGGLLKAHLQLMGITFFLLWIGLSIVFHKNALTLAAIIALVDFLPMVGTGVVLIPWMLLASVEGNIQLSISLLIMYTVITFIKNILEPKIIGRQAGVSPLVSLLGIYFGARVFGLFGALLTPLGMIVIKEIILAQKKS